MKDSLFRDKPFMKKLTDLALPIAFQNLMLAAVAAADALMLGNIAQNSMAAVSLATQIQFVQNVILMSIVSACTILGAQYWGKKDMRTLGDVFCLTIRSAAAVSCLFFVGCVFFPRQLMYLFTNDEDLIAIGSGYLRIAGWSYLITGVSQCYLAMLKITDRPSEAAKISSVTVVLNIALNSVFIFGLFGIPKRDAQGAAAATLIARIVELIWAVCASHAKTGFRLNLRRLFARIPLLQADFNKCLFPLIGAGLFWGVGFTAYTAFVGHLGADAAAANSVASVVRDLICCLCNGLSSGGGIMIGNELGAGKLDKGKLYGDRVAFLGFLCGFSSMGLMLLLTPLIVRFVRLTEGASDYLTGMMLIMSVYMIGRAVNTVIINGIFDSGGDTLFDFYSLAVTMWGLAVPLAALGTFVFHWPVLLVYACTCLDEVGKIPWVMYHYKKYLWVKDLTRDAGN